MEDDRDFIKGKEDKETGKYKGGRIQKLIDDHERSKQNAIEGMALIYGPDIVFRDKGEYVKDIEPKKGKVAQQYNQMKVINLFHKKKHKNKMQSKMLKIKNKNKMQNKMLKIKNKNKMQNKMNKIKNKNKM